MSTTDHTPPVELADAETIVELADADFDAWLTTGTVATRTVEIHHDMALVARFEDLDAKLRAAEKAVADAGGDEALDDEDPREAILAEIEALAEQWDTSKSLWTVRALSDDEIQGTFDKETGVPVIKPPNQPPQAAGKAAQDAFMDKVIAYNRKVHNADEERKLHRVALAVTTVQTPGGIRHGATVEQLRVLRSRPHGKEWIDLLDAGVKAAGVIDVEIPRPTSPGRSTSDPG